ncbi:unnamed protein product [Dracunculus medinensis]|uniref:FERM domain-containing protein n=1 Tax=Dracunculus medinensis TaxID=318479 RepID=A0A0N4UGQ3_DRAME|nr:unnamed protein product [Dracunculus medinensis]
MERINVNERGEESPCCSRSENMEKANSLKFPPFNHSGVYIIPSLSVNLSIGFKYVQVETLSDETLLLAVHEKCKVRDVYLCCCSHLNIKNDQILGLALRNPSEGIGCNHPRYEYFFLEFDQSISKYAPKHSRFSYSRNDLINNRPFLMLYIRVRLFVDMVQLIRCRNTLEQYYLQLRHNLLDQWSASNSVPEERCWEMTALALQVDQNREDIKIEQYFPLWVINIRGFDFIRQNLAKIQKHFKNISKIGSMQEYCQQASRSPFALNCHLYGLRRSKADVVDNAVIGITPKGVDICGVENDGERILLQSLQWRKISKLSFDKRKLSIAGVGNSSSISLYAQSEFKARYILEFCRSFHQATIHSHSQLRLDQCKHMNTFPRKRKLLWMKFRKMRCHKGKLENNYSTLSKKNRKSVFPFLQKTFL